jgi:hypothetical protein
MKKMNISNDSLDTVKKLLLDLLAPLPISNQTSLSVQFERNMQPSKFIASAVLNELKTDGLEAFIKSVREHRLGPMLRHMLIKHHSHIEIPERIETYLNSAYRAANFKALHAQQCLILTHRIFSQHKIRYMALKGSYLAFHAYPQASLRPMRDLDILVPEAQALEAFYLLLSKGFNRIQNCSQNPEFALKMKHQLPSLFDPVSRMVVEIHNRIGDPNQQTISLDENLWARSVQKRIGNELISFESPVDLLLHLIHHAAYHHRFDNGPLLLSDIAFLLSKHDIKWVVFWQLARQDSIVSGAMLVLKLVVAYWPNVLIDWPDFMVEEPTPQTLDDASYSLLRNYDNRRAVTLQINSEAKGFFSWFEIGFNEVFTSKEHLAGRFSVRPDTIKIYAYYFINFWRLLTNWLPRIFNLRLSDQQQEIKRLQRLDHFLKLNCHIDT